MNGYEKLFEYESGQFRGDTCELLQHRALVGGGWVIVYQHTSDHFSGLGRLVSRRCVIGTEDGMPKASVIMATEWIK